MNCCRRGRVTGQNDRIRSLPEKELGDTLRPLSDLFALQAPIRSVPGIRDIEKVRIWQAAVDGSKNGNPADTRIEDADAPSSIRMDRGS
jgi:hypothetical protein